MQPYRVWVAVGAIVGLLAVAAAAGSAHGSADASVLRARGSAAQMLGWHALAIIALGFWGAQGGTLTHVSAGLFVLGLVLFCAAIYSPAIGGPNLGMTAPVGGVALMLGWLVFAASAIIG